MITEKLDHEDILEGLTDRDLTTGYSAEDETKEILAALDELLDDAQVGDTSKPVVAEPEWSTDVRNFAGKHGPFSTSDLMKIIPILMAGRL